MPLVLILHGAGGQGKIYLEKAGWADKAEMEGFIAAAPDGLPAKPGQPIHFLRNPRLWNSGQLRDALPRSKIDDRKFFLALIAELHERLSIDPERTYVAGHSNGAGMTFRLGAELSEHFAAIAPVSGLCWLKNPMPARPLPTLFMIGTADPLLPLPGGDSNLPWGRRSTPPVEESLAVWAKALGCPPDPKTILEAEGVKVQDYGPGSGGVAMKVYFLEGHGHGWPGGSQNLPEQLTGPNTAKIKATDVIWEFFRNQARGKVSPRDPQ
jgi:polyhydroxybutyrate depolymerase